MVEKRRKCGKFTVIVVVVTIEMENCGLATLFTPRQQLLWWVVAGAYLRPRALTFDHQSVKVPLSLHFISKINTIALPN